MTVSSRHHPTQNEYKLFDRCLATVQTYKYLGLHISHDLNWNKHVNFVTSKAGKMLYLTRLALRRSSTDVKTSAYKSIVRPLLEYSSSVWDPYQTGLIHSIEMIQRKAARFCLNRYSNMD